MSVKQIPDGYHNATPYLTVDSAANALDYYKKAFGAEEVMRHGGPGGKIMHAEFKIGDSRIMISDEFPEMGAKSPKALGGSPTGIYLYVRDADDVFNRAVSSGGKVAQPLVNQFYGDRCGTVIDPFGHKWTIATRVEDVSPQELQKRMAAMAQKGAPGGAKK